MDGKLITLPLRVSLRSAQLVTRTVGGIAGCALAIPSRVVQSASSGRSRPAARDVPPRPAPGSGAPGWRQEPAGEVVSPTAVEPPLTPVTTEPEPATVAPDEFEAPTHVSEEPVLVSESAEPGAEEGAGAGVTVIEPWTGYGRMNAKDVIDRVRTANVAELAALRLYEARHRARRSVLAAVDRQLKLAASGRPA
jgi:hypothetical protein